MIVCSLLFFPEAHAQKPLATSYTKGSCFHNQKWGFSQQFTTLGLRFRHNAVTRPGAGKCRVNVLEFTFGN